MRDQAFVQGTLRDVYTIERFGSIKNAQYEAWKFLRERVTGRELTLRRVRPFFEGTARVVRGEEKDAVRAAQIEEARNERIALRARLERLDDLLTRMDEEFHGPALEALRGQMRDTG
jgi:hypothetical protein